MPRLALVVLCAVALAQQASADDLKIEAVSEVAGAHMPPNDYAMRGKTVFIISSGKGQLLAYDLSDPADPKEVFSEFYKDYSFKSLLVSEEGIAYVVGAQGLTIFDVRDPARTSLLGHHWRFGKMPVVMPKPGPLAMIRDRLFVCSQPTGLLAIDVNNPVKPTLLGVARYGRGVTRGVVRYRGSTLLANDGRGISPVDVKDPTRMGFVPANDPRYLALPELLDVAPTSDPKYAFAVGPGPILYAIDLEKPEVAATLELAELTGGREVTDLSISPDGRLLVGATDRGLAAVNIVDPRNPKPLRMFRVGLYNSRFFGDLLLSRGTYFKLMVHTVSGTETIGTVGSSRAERESETRQHRSKRPQPLRPAKGGARGPQVHEVEWTGVRRPGRGTYKTYTVSYRSAADDVWVEVDVEVPGASMRHVLTGLATGLRHVARIRTRLENGEHSPWSEWYRFDTTRPVPTWASEDAISVTATNAMLRWAVPADAERAFEGFRVYVRKKGLRGRFTVHEVHDAAARSFLIEELDAGTEYEAQVRGVYQPLNPSERTPIRTFTTAAK